jgi:purine-nucleoside phosphorylase
MLEQIKETANFLRQKTGFNSSIGIILGTGLGGLVDEIDIKHSITYEEIPNFPISTVEGHSGKLIFGLLGNKEIIVMQGRFHYYEGYDINKVVFPVRVMKFLGVKKLLISNASGGVNPEFEIGDLMIIEDHINLIPNPLIGKNIDEIGTRFPDMSDPYCTEMSSIAKEIALNYNIKLQKGTYVGVTGPTLETPAEYSYFRIIGGDTVGMSTVPEVIAARHMQMSCFAISVITDLGVPGKIQKVTHEDVQNVAEQAEPKLTQIIKELVSKI